MFDAVQLQGHHQVQVDRSRDSMLTDFGRATLDDRYLLPGESYQDLFARVASAYGDDAAHSQRLYEYISKLWFMPATPVLSNGGTSRGLPISCFLNEANDSLEGIVGLWNENVWLASRGGGIGSYWGNLRSIGEKVKTGKTSGINAKQMIEAPLKAYLLLGVEPELDCQNPQQALAASVVQGPAFLGKAADFGFGDTTDSPASNTLSSVKITTLPAVGTGTLTLNGVAVTTGQEIALADLTKLVFTPQADATTAVFTFQVRDNGVTYNVYADEEGPQRPWSLGLFPLIISSASWQKIESGVTQRVRLLDRVMADVYGPQQLLARGLHEASDRRDGAFVAINCAAIPENLLESELFGHEKGAFTGAVKTTEGKIEMAAGGTLFLDEVGDIPLPLQVKLLRFLQERVIERIGGRRPIPVDVRIICATHQNLEAMITAGSFREDLYYRLAEIVVRIPSLSERQGDAELLAHHFLSKFAREHRRQIKGFTPAALAKIADWPWPGNVRELENRIKRAVIMAEGSRLTPDDLDLGSGDEESTSLNLKRVREIAERRAIEQAIARSEGNISLTAKLLGISRPTLYYMLKDHGLEA